MNKSRQLELKQARSHYKKYLIKGDIITIANVIGVSGVAVSNWLCGLTEESIIIEEQIKQLTAIRREDMEERAASLYKISKK